MPIGIMGKKEDVMLPKPTLEQIKMWDEIENSLSEKSVEINVKFHNLPDEFRRHFASIETAKKISEIATRHKLLEDAIQRMSYIVGMVLLGEINIVNFVKSLMKECNLNEESARQLARDINSAIFLPVKESLKKIHKVPDWPREEGSNQRPVITQDDKRVVTLEEKKPEANNNVVDLREENG